MDFVLSSPKCPKWPKELREKNFHANSGIKILPNIINCWLLKLFGLMRCLLIEKFITHTSPYKKYFQPSLLNKNTKVSQGAIYLVYISVKLGLVN